MKKTSLAFSNSIHSIQRFLTKNTSTCLLLILSGMFAAGCGTRSEQSDQEAGSGSQSEKATAKAIMEAASGSNVTGQATFTEEEGKVSFELTVQNISPGVHAVHLHEKGDCSAEDASSAGGHWNPTMKPHGQRTAGGAYHKGDIGNMEVGEDGKGTLTLLVEGWTIGGADSTNVVGKSVIVHDKADDFTSQPSGNAGSRISCGVIKRD